MVFDIPEFIMKWLVFDFCFLLVLTIIYAFISCASLKSKRKVSFKRDMCLILYHASIFILNLVNISVMIKEQAFLIFPIIPLALACMMTLPWAFEDNEENFEIWCEKFRHNTIRSYTFAFSIYLIFIVVLFVIM